VDVGIALVVLAAVVAMALSVWPLSKERLVAILGLNSPTGHMFHLMHPLSCERVVA
jgi:hypothetical protein